jgi:hypothetical protein
MASDPGLVDDRPWINPRPFLLAGMICMLAGALTASTLAGTDWVWVPPVLLAAAGVLTGSAVAISPRSSIVTGLAALVFLIGSFGFVACQWDSAVILFRILAVLGAFAALVVQLPAVWRKVIASVLIIVHFLGIFTAVSTVPPAAVWLCSFAWTYFYRPYLQFMYLNNAYHFYAPEPGPASLLWFFIEYEPDAEGRHWRWVKVPELDHDGRPLRPDHTRLWPNVEYTRRLSLVEYAGQPNSDPIPDFQNLWLRRLRAGEFRGIPAVPNAIPQSQYFRINQLSMLFLQDYVRHVAHTYHHEKKPELNVSSVKVYRTVHRLLMPPDMVRGTRPDDEGLFHPVYMGEYDRNGNVMRYVDPDDPTSDAPDPFLFWEIPIVKDEATGKVTNYVLRHANVPDEGIIP